MIAWSWSRLESFESCPKKFYHENIKKDYKPDFEAPHFVKGNRIHAKLENALKSGVVDPEIKSMAGVVMKLRGTTWDYLGIEDEYAFKSNLTPTSWRDWKSCWVRCKMDFVGIKNKVALLIDWKTGKNRGYKDQLALNAVVAMQAHSEVDEVRTLYHFVEEPKEKRVEKKVFFRSDVDQLWQDFGDRAEEIEIANEKNHWPERKHFGCRWCPIKECKNYEGA